MTELLLSPASRQQIALVIKSPPHALLISGPAGSGKRAVADYLAASLLGISTDKLFDHPYFMLVTKAGDKKEISIDAVRDVIARLNLKPATRGRQYINRVVLIDEAHLSSAEAQNSLLKVIEEPPAGTVFLLTTNSETVILPTIASRAQKLKIGTVSLSDAKSYFADKYDLKTLSSAWQLSGGSAGLLAAILADNQQHPLKQSVETAKRFLSLGPYERFLLLDNISGQRAEFTQMLDALSRVLGALHRSAVKSGRNPAGLLKSRRMTDSALVSLSTNTSPRLIALNLALSLSV
jgi:DNA polymerase-3 subunit delta'